MLPVAPTMASTTPKSVMTSAMQVDRIRKSTVRIEWNRFAVEGEYCAVEGATDDDDDDDDEDDEESATTSADTPCSVRARSLSVSSPRWYGW